MGKMKDAVDFSYGFALVLFLTPVLIFLLGPWMLDTDLIAPMFIRPWGWVVVIAYDLIMLLVILITGITLRRLIFVLPFLFLLIIFCVNIVSVFSGYSAPRIGIGASELGLFHSEFIPFNDQIIAEYTDKSEDQVNAGDRRKYYKEVWLKLAIEERTRKKNK